MSYDLQRWVANEAKGRRRPWARWLLALGLVATIVAAIATVGDRAADPRDFTALMPWGLLPLVGLYYSPFGRDVWVGTARHANYDEFERQLLHRATAVAYHLNMTLAALLVIWLWLATLYDLPRPTRPIDWSAVFYTLCVTAGTMPVLVAEFMLPLPAAGEAEA